MSERGERMSDKMDMTLEIRDKRSEEIMEDYTEMFNDMLHEDEVR